MIIPAKTDGRERTSPLYMIVYVTQIIILRHPPGVPYRRRPRNYIYTACEIYISVIQICGMRNGRPPSKSHSRTHLMCHLLQLPRTHNISTTSWMRDDEWATTSHDHIPLAERCHKIYEEAKSQTAKQKKSYVDRSSTALPVYNRTYLTGHYILCI